MREDTLPNSGMASLFRHLQPISLAGREIWTGAAFLPFSNAAELCI